MWRIHFDAEDLLRTRVVQTLGPLAETMLAFHMLHSRCSELTAFHPWRESVRGRLTPVMRPLADLLPRGTFGVDLWSLTGETATIEEGVQAILSMRPAAVRAEVEAFAESTELPSGAWEVAERGSRGRGALAQAALASYHTLVHPHWARISDHLRAERMARGRMLLDAGVEGLLSTLHPRIRWRAPVLEIRVPGEADVHLGGRGLLLVPSVFVGDKILVLSDVSRPEDPPRLVFSASREPREIGMMFAPDRPTSGALSALLGHNRATVLRRIADGSATTSELAQRAGISLASASQHATVLRKAGLITTRRYGGAVLHALTNLGADLLEGT